ncbi:MAG: choice-of-anchor B family protein [Flavobacteriaceae bacterium]|nr:choice-of-anchor B family protein [Flavobacteriaceae bacterium]
MIFKNKSPKAITYVLFITFSLFVFQNCSTENIDLDPDNDGITGTLDNCQNTANPDQEDSDNDGLGDACDDDDDNDGIPDADDNCPTVANPNQEDFNDNGVGDVCEDSDGDTIFDAVDNCIDIENPNQEDFDNDGIGNLCDEDYTAPISPCEDGMAGIYPCDGYDLMGFVDVADLGGVEGNDSWGWTDPTTGKEYAIVGTNTGTAFIDISDTQNLLVLGTLQTATTNSSWRDIKVYNDYAFIVSEASGHGMQIFDLTRLRNVTSAPETFTTDAHYTGFGNAHNILINENTGYAYAVGTNTFSGGAHFINIQDPINPVAAGGFSAGGYSHDAQVVTYTGPDSDYIGREIFVGSNGNKIVIADVTDKASPVLIKNITYGSIAYAHQGWFTEDLKYFIVGDELDEWNFGGNTKTLIFDFTDLDNPFLDTTYTGPTTAIDHNGYVKGNTYYLSNYSAGIRFLDISDIENGNIVEEGFFDSFPTHDNTSFNGVWSVYPYFESGNIIISDIEKGLLIVRKSGT